MELSLIYLMRPTWLIGSCQSIAHCETKEFSSSGRSPPNSRNSLSPFPQVADSLHFSCCQMLFLSFLVVLVFLTAISCWCVEPHGKRLTINDFVRESAAKIGVAPSQFVLSPTQSERSTKKSSVTDTTRHQISDHLKNLTKWFAYCWKKLQLAKNCTIHSTSLFLQL